MGKRSVVWTETAARQRKEILKYWTKHNSCTVFAEELIKLIADRIQIVLRHPKLFKTTTYLGTRESAMGHFSLFYKLDKNTLIITAFWDNWQDQKQLLEIVKKLL